MVPMSSNSEVSREQMKDPLQSVFANLRKDKLDCSVSDLDDLIRTLDYSTFLAVVRSHNSLGPVLGSLAAKGHVAYVKCILHHIEPGDRRAVCRLTGDGKQTILHLASAHGQVDVIRRVNELFEKVRSDWLLLVALPDASGSTALDYAARRQSSEDRSISEALLQGLTPTDQSKLIGKSKTFQKVASKSDLFQIMEPANSSAVSTESESDALSAKIKQMVQAEIEKYLPLMKEQAEELEQLRPMKKMVKELNAKLMKCQGEIQDLQSAKFGAKLSGCEQKLEELMPVIRQLGEIEVKVGKLQQQLGEVQLTIGEFQEVDLVNKVEGIGRFVQNCQRWKEVNLEALAEQAEEAQEADVLDPIQRDLKMVKRCLKTLSVHVEDLHGCCAFLPNGKPETADASCGSDNSPNTFTPSAPEDDSGSSESGSTSRTTSSDDLLSQDVHNPSLPSSTLGADGETHSSVSSADLEAWTLRP